VEHFPLMVPGTTAAADGPNYGPIRSAPIATVEQVIVWARSARWHGDGAVRNRDAGLVGPAHRNPPAAPGHLQERRDSLHWRAARAEAASGFAGRGRSVAVDQRATLRRTFAEPSGRGVQ